MQGGKNRKLKNQPNPIEFGYIIIPKEVNRDEYIETCFRLMRVSVMIEGGLYLRDIFITNECIQNIQFPKNPGEKGTAVVISTNPYNGSSIVIGTYASTNESSMLSEESYSFKKKINGIEASVVIDPKNKKTIIQIDSPEEGDIVIRTTGSDKVRTSIESTGEVNVKSDKKVQITSYNTIQLDVVNPDKEKIEKETHRVTMNLDEINVTRTNENDKTAFVKINKDQLMASFRDGEESIELKDDEVHIVTKKKVNINGGAEPWTLGDTAVEKLDELEKQVLQIKDAFKSAAVGSMDGGAVFKTNLIAATSSIVKIDFTPIKSKVSFSD